MSVLPSVRCGEELLLQIIAETRVPSPLPHPHWGHQNSSPYSSPVCLLDASWGATIDKRFYSSGKQASLRVLALKESKQQAEASPDSPVMKSSVPGSHLLGSAGKGPGRACLACITGGWLWACSENQPQSSRAACSCWPVWHILCITSQARPGHVDHLHGWLSSRTQTRLSCTEGWKKRRTHSYCHCRC